MIATLLARLIALWDDSWFFQVNAILLVVGFLFLLFSS